MKNNYKRKTVTFSITPEEEKIIEEMIKHNIYIKSFSHFVEISVNEYVEQYEENKKQ